MLRKLIVITGLLFSSQAAVAAWGPHSRIVEYFVYDGGDAYFITDGNQNYGGCSSTQYVVLNAAANNFKAIWAQIIAAQAAGLTVSVNFDGCYNGYPRAIAVAIKPS